MYFIERYFPALADVLGDLVILVNPFIIIFSLLLWVSGFGNFLVRPSHLAWGFGLLLYQILWIDFEVLILQILVLRLVCLIWIWILSRTQKKDSSSFLFCIVQEPVIVKHPR